MNALRPVSFVVCGHMIGRQENLYWWELTGVSPFMVPPCTPCSTNQGRRCGA
jgi:hypothetical protein